MIFTYSSLTRMAGNDEAYVQVREALLHDLLRSVISSVEVDEKWYRAKYLDIDDAIKGGVFENARSHYIASGYFEGRMPRDVKVDANWYITAYADVAHAIEAGQEDNAQSHFEKSGFKEGRLPHEGWSL